MSTYLKHKDPKIKFVQGLLEQINNESSFNAREHKYKVERKFLNSQGEIELKEVSPRSVSAFVSEHGGKFNEKNWDLPSQRSGISVKDLVHNRLLAQLMGCIKGSIIHDYLEKFALGQEDKNFDLSKVIRAETQAAFYPNLKNINNGVRSALRNIDLQNDVDVSLITKKIFPKLPEGVLAEDLKQIKNINQIYDGVYQNLKGKNIQSFDDLKDILRTDLNMPENTIEDICYNFSNNCDVTNLTIEDYSNSFAELSDNSFLGMKESLYSSSLLCFENKLIELKDLRSSVEINPLEFMSQYKDKQREVNQLKSDINNMFLLNPEITSKTIAELKKEEYELNRDIKIATNEVFDNLNAGKMLDKINELGIKIIGVECRLNMKGVIGTGDLFGMNKDGTIVTLDYKTNKGVLSKTSREHYGFQLNMYDKMAKDRISELIGSNKTLQRAAKKAYGVSNWEQAVEVICKPHNPILLHISSVDKITDRDKKGLVNLALQNVLAEVNKSSFLNDTEKNNFIKDKLSIEKDKITKIFDNVDSCKLIYTPEMLTEIVNHKPVDVKISNVVDHVFDNSFVEIRSPANYIYSNTLDMIVPDTTNNREQINKFSLNVLVITDDEVNNFIKSGVLDNSLNTTNKNIEIEQIDVSKSKVDNEMSIN